MQCITFSRCLYQIPVDVCNAQDLAMLLHCCSQLFLGAAGPWVVMANWGGAWGGVRGGGGWSGGGGSSSSWGGGGWGESGSSRGRSRGHRSRGRSWDDRGSGGRRAGGGLSPQRGSNSHAPLPKGQGDRPRTTGAETHTQAQPSPPCDRSYMCYFLFLNNCTSSQRYAQVRRRIRLVRGLEI